MEKVYMELPKNSRVWKNEDISPYDFKDDLRNEKIDFNEDEYDMDMIMDDLDSMDFEDECSPESDMYENENIDWRCNEDISQSVSKMIMEKKMIVESEEPKQKTTTWIRITRVY